jgi:hypothetical protein
MLNKANDKQLSKNFNRYLINSGQNGTKCFGDDYICDKIWILTCNMPQGLGRGDKLQSRFS